MNTNNLQSNITIVDANTSIVEYKKTNNIHNFYRNINHELVNGSLVFPRILKVLEDRKNEIGVNLLVDVRNYYEEFEAELVEKNAVQNLDISFQSGDVNREIVLYQGKFDNIFSLKNMIINLNSVYLISGNVFLQIEVSQDGNVWEIYSKNDITHLGGSTSNNANRTNVKSMFQTTVNKYVNMKYHSMHIRVKANGNGRIEFSGNPSPLRLTALCDIIASHRYIPIYDNENNIMVSHVDSSGNLVMNRNLLHADGGFYSDPAILKRNQSQAITIKLVSNGSYTTIYQGTYSGNFIDKINTKQSGINEYAVFEYDNYNMPTISVNSKTIQLLSEKNGIYVNKLALDKDTEIIKHGFEIINGVTFYRYNNTVIDDYNSYCRGLKYKLKQKINFSGISSGSMNLIDLNIFDAVGNSVSTGACYFDETNRYDDQAVIEKIKGYKTFMNLNVVFYNTFGEREQALVDALSACRKTPNAVILMKDNPNISYIDDCFIDKISLGGSAFTNELKDKMEKDFGVMFSNEDMTLRSISEYIISNFDSQKITCSRNVTGINFYNFTDRVINSNSIDYNGFFINECVKDLKKLAKDKIIYRGYSENNSLEGIVQYDIGSVFDIEFNVSEIMPNVNPEMLNESNYFPGNRKPFDTVSIVFKDNIAFDYIVGEEEVTVIRNDANKNKYSISMRDGAIRIGSLNSLSVSDRGNNKLEIILKKNGIITGYGSAEFLVDYPEPKIDSFNITTSDTLEEDGYNGKTDIVYTKDNFFKIDVSLNAVYDFLDGEYELRAYHKNDNKYKHIKPLKGRFQYKTFNIHIDDIFNAEDRDKKLKFGEWTFEVVRNRFNLPIKTSTCNVNANILESLALNAIPVEVDYDDYENNGLQQGKDVYINLKITNSNYFKNIKDLFTFVKEVRVISNNMNFTKKPNYFTYLDEKEFGSEHSLTNVTSHQGVPLNQRDELRWFISGKAAGDSNMFLNPIANLSSESKAPKKIKINLVLFSGELIETQIVTIGETGKVSQPIVLGSQEHLYKLKNIEAKKNNVSVDNLTSAQLAAVDEQWKQLGKRNYDNQQMVNGNKVFCFYSNLIEIVFDFGIAEYYTVSQTNTSTDMIPVTRDGILRFIIDEDGIDDNGRGYLTVKGYVKLNNGLTVSSDETTVMFYRKRNPSLVTTGDDYTRYVFFEKNQNNYHELKTVIQSEIRLETLNGTYSSNLITHIEVDLVDIDKRTVIASGPDVKFYDGFIPQKFIFDTGITEEMLENINPGDRFPVESAVNYIEIEKILNEQIFSMNRHLGQTFYLRMRAVETTVNAYDEIVLVKGKDSFYPIEFVESLEELKIIPSNGIIIVDKDEEELYTYKNKVTFILESNNAEYFMYRTDRAASFQKVFPKSIGYSKIVNIVVSTYDVGNHFIEVKQKAVGEPETNVYSKIVEKLNPVTAPKITGKKLIDDTPTFLIHPVYNAAYFNISMTSDNEEHSNLKLVASPYEVDYTPNKFLDNGYHTVQAYSEDKIGNTSEPFFFVTKKISRPIASPIIGLDKTSNSVISWKWDSQINEGVREYMIELNGIEKAVIPINRTGKTEYSIRFFQGRELTDGTYEVKVWAVNELGNRNYSSSDFVTMKGSVIKELAISMYKFYGNYTNRLDVEILTEDPAIKEIEYQILKNDSSLTPVTEILKTNKKKLDFTKANGDRINLEDGNYILNVRAVNYIDEKTDYVKTYFTYSQKAPERPYTYFPRLLKNNVPLIFAKPSSNNPPILAIEVKIGDNNFQKINNNVWRPSYNIASGINNIIFKVTDYAGNQAEFSDFIDITERGVNMFQGDFIVDINNPVLTFDFNLSEMIVYGHPRFRVECEQLSIDTIVEASNANEIAIPLTHSQSELYPDGVYPFVVKLFDQKTGEYDYIGDIFYVTINSRKPEKPYFINSGYSNLEPDVFYTQNRNPMWIWQTRQNIDDIKEFIINLLKYDEDERNYIEYGVGQFTEFSTKRVGQFQVPGDLEDGRYKLLVKSLGTNGLHSPNAEFTYIVKNSLPVPPMFDTTSKINRKYESRNKGVTWVWEDTNDDINKFIAYKIKLNEEEFSEEFSATKNFYEENRILKDGPNTIYVIGKDKAGNWSSSNDATAGMFGSNYMSHTKVIDTKFPEPLEKTDVNVMIKDSNTVEVFFNDKEKENEYYLFNLFVKENSEDSYVKLVEGNTLDSSYKNQIFLYEEIVVPGISVGKEYCEIIVDENDSNNKHLVFDNLLPNEYFLRVVVCDYAGNVSAEYVQTIELKDLTRIKPIFIYPKDMHTNNSTLIYQWILDADNIKGWEYQLSTPYNGSSVDLLNPAKWRQISENNFKLNNIPKIVAGNDADGEYTFYVRAIFDEQVEEAGTGLMVFKKSDIGVATVVLDRKAPGGIVFTNKEFTTDNSVLRWTWNYTSDGDTAAGTYVTFNPNLPMSEWEKIENKAEYESYQEREDGTYTLYAKTFDLAGNINDNVYQNTIILDRIPPFRPVITGGTNIFTNKIPNVSWENDINYFKYTWLIMTSEEFEEFNSIYKDIVETENYDFQNEDWEYIFLNREVADDSVHPRLVPLKEFFRKNEPLIENNVTVNSTEVKNGISEEGEYVFILSGFDQSDNWAEEFEYQYITYDITAPDITQMKFIEPVYVITDDRRPKWIWEVPYDVTKCEYVLEKNGYSDGSISGTLTKTQGEQLAKQTFEFRPQFNLTSGNYRLIVNCYDASNNYVQISKSISIETESSTLEKEFAEIVLPGQNNKIRIQKNKFSNTYVIVDIDIDKNSTLSYRVLEEETTKKEFTIYEIGVTELQMDLEYEFNIVSYSVIVD